MSYKRNSKRGPGSNQHADKPPLPPTQEDVAATKGKAQHVQEMLFSIVDEPMAIDIGSVSLNAYINPDSGLTPEEWADEFVSAATSFTTGKSGMENKLFGLMQYVPEGARYPEEITEPFAEKLRNEGLFSYDIPDPEPDNGKLVNFAFERAVATKKYTKAYDEETSVLSSIENTKQLVTELKEISSLLDSGKLNLKKVEKLIQSASGLADSLKEKEVGDSRSRSQVLSSVKMMKKEIGGTGFDQRNMSERASTAVKNSLSVFKHANSFYVMKAPDWMNAIYERSFYFFRVGNFDRVSRHFKEIEDMTSRGYECAANGVTKDASSGKRRMNKIAKKSRDIRGDLSHCKQGDLSAVSKLEDIFMSFHGVLGT